MDIDSIREVVRPVVGVFGLLIFTHGLGRLVAAPRGGDASRDAQVRKGSMLLFWILFFTIALEPRAPWTQLVLLLGALVYLAAVFVAPLRRVLFGLQGGERDDA